MRGLRRPDRLIQKPRAKFRTQLTGAAKVLCLYAFVLGLAASGLQAAPASDGRSIVLKVRVGKVMSLQVDAAKQSIDVEVTQLRNTINFRRMSDAATFSVKSNVAYDLLVTGDTWSHSARGSRKYIKLVNPTTQAHFAARVFVDALPSNRTLNRIRKEFRWSLNRGYLEIKNRPAGDQDFAMGATIFPNIWNNGVRDMPLTTYVTADPVNPYSSTLTITAIAR